MRVATRAVARTPNATRDARVRSSRLGTVARATTSETRVAVVVAIVASSAMEVKSASAGAVSERLAAVLDAADVAADGAADAFDRAMGVANRGVELFNETAPVVTPYIDRGLKAAAPIGDAVGKYAGRNVVPVVNEGLKQANSVSAQAYKEAYAQLKAQGVDVEPIAKGLSDGVQTGVAAAVPVAKQIGDYLTSATPEELATTAGELFLAYLIAPVFFKILGDIARGYKGDLRPIEAYDMLLSENAVVVDTRGADVTVALPGGARKRVLVCTIEKSGFGSAAAKVNALKIASLRGVGKGKKVIILDQNGGNAKALAKALAKQGFGNVFTVKGGYNAWSRAGLATTNDR